MLAYIIYACMIVTHGTHSMGRRTLLGQCQGAKCKGGRQPRGYNDQGASEQFSDLNQQSFRSSQIEANTIESIINGAKGKCA